MYVSILSIIYMYVSIIYTRMYVSIIYTRMYVYIIYTRMYVSIIYTRMYVSIYLGSERWNEIVRYLMEPLSSSEKDFLRSVSIFLSL